MQFSGDNLFCLSRFKIFFHQDQFHSTNTFNLYVQWLYQEWIHYSGSGTQKQNCNVYWNYWNIKVLLPWCLLNHSNTNVKILSIRLSFCGKSMLDRWSTTDDRTFLPRSFYSIFLETSSNNSWTYIFLKRTIAELDLSHKNENS